MPFFVLLIFCSSKLETSTEQLFHPNQTAENASELLLGNDTGWSSVVSGPEKVIVEILEEAHLARSNSTTEGE
jgi:hypothetical protein